MSYRILLEQHDYICFLQQLEQTTFLQVRPAFSKSWPAACTYRTGPYLSQLAYATSFQSVSVPAIIDDCVLCLSACKMCIADIRLALAQFLFSRVGFSNQPKTATILQRCSDQKFKSRVQLVGFVLNTTTGTEESNIQANSHCFLFNPAAFTASAEINDEESLRTMIPQCCLRIQR